MLRSFGLNTVIFDLGGVLIDWNPRYLFKKLISDPEELEHFLANIVTHDWNASFDEGRSFAEGVLQLSAKHPGYKDLISAYHSRWQEMLGQSIEGTVEILKSLAQTRRYRLLALSNWSAETFHFAREKFEFLKLFETILVSGEEKLMKPNPAFYLLLKSRLGVDLTKAVFIDDVKKNIDAARTIGLQAIHFQSPPQLRGDLESLGIKI